MFAYACEPGKGSEPAAGWGIVRALESTSDCTALVGPEHAEGLAAWKRAHPDSELRFIEVAEPWWARFFTRGRFGRFIRYLGWLRRARAVGGRLHRDAAFDVVQHATYSAYWLPSPVVDFGVPSIWGPVGGAVTTPPALRRTLGWRGEIVEWFDRVAVRFLAALPASRRTQRLATVVLVQNPETRRCLPKDVQDRATILNHALFTEPPGRSSSIRSAQGRHCLVVNPLESRKGVRLALYALSRTAPDIDLHIAGDGPELAALHRLTTRLGLAKRVTFLGRVAHDDVLDRMSDAAAILFTGLREEGGIGLAEAMLLGVPTIVLAHGGAGVIAAQATDPRRMALIEPGEFMTTATAFAAAMTRFCRTPYCDRSPLLDPHAAAEPLRALVRQITRASQAANTETA